MAWQSESHVATSSFEAAVDFSLLFPSAVYTSHEDSHFYTSFDDSSGGNNADDCVQTTASGVANLVSSTWLPQIPSGTSGTLSSGSYLSGSECITTPMYPGHPPLTSQPQSQDDFYNWPQYFTGAEAHALPVSLPIYDEYGGQPMPSVDHYIQPYQSNAPFDPQDQDSSVSSGSGNVNGNGSDTESDNSDEEDEDSSHSQRKRSCSSSTSKYKTSPRMSEMNLGQWVESPRYPITHAKQGDFVCPFSEQRDANGEFCEKRFRRPEHLRRHVDTVHGTDRLHVCLIPVCKKPFSRGDNLQEHYWTHVERGGLPGRNCKMSLEGLKCILGPDGTTLAKKLEGRLIKYKRKQKLNRQKPEAKL